MATRSSTRTDADHHAALARDLFAHSASRGRDSLDAAGLAALGDALGIICADTSAPTSSVAFAVRLTASREFGVVIGAGVGGLDGVLDRNLFQRDRAWVSAAVALTDAAAMLDAFRGTIAYQRMAMRANYEHDALPDRQIEALFERLIAFGRQAGQGELVLRELEFDRLRIGDSIQAAHARCTFGASARHPLPRPIHKIDKLLHPASIGVIGVSASSMNFGRIILHNLVDSGYPRERLCILRPGEDEIDGVRCVAGLNDLEDKLDLLIVAVAADAVYELVDEIIASDRVESVMLIPGGLGETQRSKAPAAELAQRINAAHGRPGGGPVFLGANCLGVVSHAGGYDSWFIPLERLPKPQKKAERNSVMLSQSGAFMITRLSRNPWLDPRYMMALGNQTDLTHGDMLSYFAERPEIETIGVYIEGFKDLDGLAFAQAVRRAVIAGKQVVVYKSGRTEAGIAGVQGHTASIAGDPALFASVLRQAGAMVAQDFEDFDDLFYVAGALHHKRIGRRLGAISGAGFEAVGMADASATEGFALEVPTLAEATVAKVEEILRAKRLDALVEVRNPIDINQGADDEAHLQIVEAFAADPEIDAVIVGLDPTAPAVRALESSAKRPGFDIHDPMSTVHLMPPIVERSDKPIIGIVDGGPLYDAMAAALMDRGVCVFRNCARGTRALVRYVEARERTDRLRAAASSQPPRATSMEPNR